MGVARPCATLADLRCKSELMIFYA
jgi:hypothetical protein